MKRKDLTKTVGLLLVSFLVAVALAGCDSPTGSSSGGDSIDDTGDNGGTGGWSAISTAVSNFNAFDNSEYFDIAATADGVLYVALVDGNDQIVVGRYGDGSWSFLDTSAVDDLKTSQIDTIALEVGDGNVYLGYRTDTDKAAIAVYDGSSWTLNSYEDGAKPHRKKMFLIDSVPHLFFVEGDGQSARPTLVKLEDSNLVPVGDFAATISEIEGTIYYPTIGRPELAIAWSDDGTMYALAARSNASNVTNQGSFDLFEYDTTDDSWSHVSNDFIPFTMEGAGTDNQASIAFGDDDLLIAYIHENKVIERTYDGSAFSTPTDGFVAPTESNTMRRVNTVQGLDGKLYMVAESSLNGGSVMVFRQTATGWATVGGGAAWSDLPASWAGTRLAVSADGTVFVTRADWQAIKIATSR